MSVAENRRGAVSCVDVYCRLSRDPAPYGKTEGLGLLSLEPADGLSKKKKMYVN